MKIGREIIVMTYGAPASGWGDDVVIEAACRAATIVLVTLGLSGQETITHAHAKNELGYLE